MNEGVGPSSLKQSINKEHKKAETFNISASLIGLGGPMLFI